MFVAVDFTLKNHLQSKLYDILSLFLLCCSGDSIC